jgi:PiT family inorganic phosphate transporter
MASKIPGCHLIDTANAVATVIYTNSLSPNLAVVWSGFFNFLGVLFSTGAVAFGIVSLLPVELILQVGSGAGFAMVFALLIAAIVDSRFAHPDLLRRELFSRRQ